MYRYYLYGCLKVLKNITDKILKMTYSSWYLACCTWWNSWVCCTSVRSEWSRSKRNCRLNTNTINRYFRKCAREINIKHNDIFYGISYGQLYRRFGKTKIRRINWGTLERWWSGIGFCKIKFWEVRSPNSVAIRNEVIIPYSYDILRYIHHPKNEKKSVSDKTVYRFRLFERDFLYL